jgi:hypothetical protein
MKHIQYSSRSQAVRRNRYTLAVLIALSIPSLHAQAQGVFGGVRVSGVELVAERPPRVIDPNALPPDVARTPDVALARPVPASDRVTMPQATVPSVRVPPAGPSGPPGSGRPAPSKSPAPRPPAPADITLLSAPDLFTSSSLCRPLSLPGARTALDRAMLAMLREQVNQQLGGNYVHSNSNHQFSQTCRAHAEYHGNRLTVKMSIPRNRIFLQIMTRGLVGEIMSENMDPNFWTHYDLDLTATFLLPTTANGRIEQESLYYSASNIDQPDSRSFTGKLLLAANALSRFLGGPDFVARLRQTQDGQLGSLVGLDLAAFHKALEKAPVADARIDITHRGSQLVMRATQQPPAPGPRVN